MKYMLLIYLDENAMNETEREQCYVESTQLSHDLHAQGQYLGASPLSRSQRRRACGVREGKRLVTDGPFAETREQLGGYFLVEAKDLDEAIGIAARFRGQEGDGRSPAGAGTGGPADENLVAAICSRAACTDSRLAIRGGRSDATRRHP